MKTNYNKDVKQIIKWSKISMIATIGTGVFSLIPALINVLEEFTDIEIKVPFFCSGIFIWIMVVIMATFLTLMIISSIKTRKYRKLIEKDENNEDANGQPDDEDEKTL